MDAALVGIDALGFYSASYAELNALRKELPAWGAADISGHFFKYADEQTIVATRAMTRAIEDSGIDPTARRDWGILAAPQHLGRVAGATVLARFARGGVPLLSPHTIPHHSLHSVSGALSILLDCQGPNVGVGGGPHAWQEGLLSAATIFDSRAVPGLWLVATGWNPEPLPDETGRVTNEARCHALVLALRPGAVGACGMLSIAPSRTPLEGNARESTRAVEPQVPEVSRVVRRLQAEGGRGEFDWRCGWGVTVQLNLKPPVRPLRAAA